MAHDSKTRLNMFCQRHAEKVFSKGDVVYETTKFDDSFQSIVTLHCLGGLKYAGELCKTVKLAEQSAARIAADDCATRNFQPPTGPRRAARATAQAAEPAAEAALAAGAAGAEWAVPVPQENPDPSPKMELNTLMMRILKQPLRKSEDVHYSSVQTALGYQCTVSLPGLPPEWSPLAWAGEVAGKKKRAEENAARHAVAALLAHPAVVAALAAGERRPEGQRQEKQNGKPSTSPARTEKPANVPADGGPASAEPLPRELLGGAYVSGKVAEWRGRYGWIDLDEPFDHPEAGRNRGRIYLHVNDWQVSDGPPKVGSPVQFHLYVDRLGLGAVAHPQALAPAEPPP